MNSERIAEMAAWTVAVVLTATFLLSAAPKLFGAPPVVEQFQRWGYGDGLRLAAGLVELVAGVLLLVPRCRFAAALALAVVMAGAIYTHLSTGIGSPVLAVLFLLALIALAWRSRPGSGMEVFDG